MMFDLSVQAASAAAQEAGVTLDLVAPGGNDVLARLVLAGPDSRKAIESRREGWRAVFDKRSAGDKSEVTDEEIREAGTRFLAGCVLSWDGFMDGGKPMACTPENVMLVFSQVPWVEHACDMKIGDRANFTPA